MEKNEQASKVVDLTNPQSCYDLALYYQNVSEMEKSYLSDQILAWMNSNRFPLREDNWQDAVNLLNLENTAVSDTWLQYIYNQSKNTLTQPDWLKTALMTTLLRLKPTDSGRNGKS